MDLIKMIEVSHLKIQIKSMDMLLLHKRVVVNLG